MKGYDMKRRIAAMLCAAMLAQTAFAFAEATPAEVELGDTEQTEQSGAQPQADTPSALSDGGDDTTTGGSDTTTTGGDTTTTGGDGDTTATGGDTTTTGGDGDTTTTGGGNDDTTGGDDDTTGSSDDDTTTGGNDDTTGGDDDTTTGGGNDDTTGGGNDDTTTGGDDDTTTGGDDDTTTGGDDDTTAGGSDDDTTTGGNNDTTTGGNDDDTTGGDDDTTTGGDDDTTSGGDDDTTTGGDDDTTTGGNSGSGSGDTTTGGNSGSGDTTTPSGKYEVSVSQSKGTLTVNVTGAYAQAICVEITKPDGSSEMKIIEAGNGSATFTGLAAGTYSFYLDYATQVSGVSPVTPEDVELKEGADVVTVVDGQFSVAADVSGTSIVVTVTGAKAQAVDVVLVKPDKTTDVRALSSGNGTITFSGLSAGEYSVVVAYQTEVTGVSSVNKSGLVVTQSTQTAGAIAATATGGVNRVDVRVTSASQLPVAVVLKQGQAIKSTQSIEAGVGSVSFTGLAAGTYTVVVSYLASGTGVAPYQIDNLTVTDSVAAIKITGVKGGENKLTIIGTAQPGADVTLTTEPSSAAAVVKAGTDGAFSAEITCAAGTYTAVYAQYGSDTATRVTYAGTFTATASLTKPPISVDTITEKTLTVVAQSTPGAIVNLGTYDYGQTVTADERGILRYSLPHEYAQGTKVTFTVYYGNGKEFSYQYAVTVESYKSYTLLKRGSYGYDVYLLTERLAALGYPVSATKTYNDTVVAAVRLFQQANGLSVDGQAGQLTQTALYSVSAIGYGQSGAYPTLVRGDKGIALIYTLQQRLKELGYYTIRVDGIFGSGTQRAVREFQATNGLPVTGKADNATQQLLYSSAAKAAGSETTGSYVTLTRSGYYDARVVTLQRRLKALGYAVGSVDGYYGSKTYRAVRSFQSRNGLTVTGTADAYTQQVLYSSAAKAASGSSSTSTSSGYRLLYWGCTGDAVTRLQKALLSAGYTQVKVADGIYGQWTYNAVCAYQKDHGLAVDGVAGKNTQNSLYGTSY